MKQKIGKIFIIRNVYRKIDQKLQKLHRERLFWPEIFQDKTAFAFVIFFYTEVISQEGVGGDGKLKIFTGRRSARENFNLCKLKVKASIACFVRELLKKNSQDRIFRYKMNEKKFQLRNTKAKNKIIYVAVEKFIMNKENLNKHWCRHGLRSNPSKLQFLGHKVSITVIKTFVKCNLLFEF